MFNMATLGTFAAESRPDPSVAHRCHRVIHLHDGKVHKDERNARHAVQVEGGQLSV